MRKTNGHHPNSSSTSKKTGLGGRLTIKQQRFVDAYIRNGGNGTGAVFDAGYNTVSERSVQVDRLPEPEEACDHARAGGGRIHRLRPD